MEMEAAAFRFRFRAQETSVWFASLTSRHDRADGDFEKRGADGAGDALAVLERVTTALA
jgi:hypothetical protein